MKRYSILVRYLLVGNYGAGNAGDEALREYFVRKFPDVHWQVVSAQPKQSELPRFPGGLRSLLTCEWICTLRALRGADGLVFGGGSLFTDSESLRACFIWFLPAFLAHIFRKPFFLAFQGIGPFRTKLGEWLARWVVAHASFISVRDEASYERLVRGLAQLQFSRPWKAPSTQKAEFSTPMQTGAGWKKYTEVVQSFDPAIALLESKKEPIRTKNLFIFIPRFSTPRLLPILRKWQEERGPVRIISLHSGNLREHALYESLASSLSISLTCVSSLSALPSLLTGASCVLTERYHGALAALACGIPFLALRMSEGDKLDALAAFCNCPMYTLDTLSPEAVFERDWVQLALTLPPLLAQCQQRLRVGEEALREALQRFLYTVQ